jgi:hypothetical protein
MPESRLTPSPPLWRKVLPMAIALAVICLILSGLITWLLNPGEDFLRRWARSFAISLPVMPFGLALMSVLGRWLGPGLNRHSPVAAKLVLALITACVMEMLMATVVVFTTHMSGHHLLQTWLAAFLKSLPAGILIGITMAFIVKPRMERWISKA